ASLRLAQDDPPTDTKGIPYVLIDPPQRRDRQPHRRRLAEAAAQAARDPDPGLHPGHRRPGGADLPDRPELSSAVAGGRRGGPEGLRDLDPSHARGGGLLAALLGGRDDPALHERRRDHPRDGVTGGPHRTTPVPGSLRSTESYGG